MFHAQDFTGLGQWAFHNLFESTALLWESAQYYFMHT